MSSKPNIKLFSIIASSVIIGAVIFWSDLASYLSHALVNIFAGGRSSVKVFLFLLYICCLCIVNLTAISKLLQRWVPSNKLLLVTLGLNFGYGVLMLLWLFSKLQFTITSFVIAFNANEISSTALFHNHVTKSVLGYILSWFGVAIQENMDTGLAFSNLLPSWLVSIGAVLTLVSITLLILKSVELYHSKAKWSELWLLSYAVISFSVIKNLLDGGLFNREVFVAVPALVATLLLSKKQTSYKQVVFWLAAPIALYIAAVLILSKYTNTIPDVEYSLYMLAAFTAITVTLLYWQIVSKTTRLGILLAILAGTIIYSPLAQSLNAYFNSKLVIPNEGAIVGLYTEPKISIDETWTKLESIGQLNLYQVTPKSSLHIHQIMNNNELLNNLGPLTIPWVSCLPYSPKNKVSFQLASPETVNFQPTSHQYSNIAKAEQIEDATKTKLYWYNLVVESNHCTPRSLNVVEQLIKEQGVKNFFIINLTEHNDRNN